MTIFGILFSACSINNHKHKHPQLKERSSLVNDLLAGFYTIWPRADRHHALNDGTPQWGGECSYPRVLNMTSTQKIKQ